MKTDSTQLVSDLSERLGLSCRTVQAVLSGSWKIASVEVSDVRRILDAANAMNIPVVELKDNIEVIDDQYIKADPVPDKRLISLIVSFFPSEATDVEIIKLIGEEEALKLFDALAGLRVYLPRCDAEKTELANIISRDAVRKLSAHFGEGLSLRIPLARDLRAIHALSNGASARDVAKYLGITESGAERMFKRFRNKGWIT